MTCLWAAGLARATPGLRGRAERGVAAQGGAAGERKMGVRAGELGRTQARCPDSADELQRIVGTTRAIQQVKQ